MLLALDAGNSNITIGAFEGRKLLCHWRLRTVHEQTADEWGILLQQPVLARRPGYRQGGRHHHRERGAAHRFHPGGHDQALLPHRSHVRHAAHRYRASRSATTIPNEVGADRLVNGVAGFYKYGGPCVVVDFGTTINFDVISARRRIPGRRHRGGHRHRHRRAVHQNRAPAAGGFPPAQGRGGHQHRGQHADRASTSAPSA